MTQYWASLRRVLLESVDCAARSIAQQNRLLLEENVIQSFGKVLLQVRRVLFV